ncbi:MAG: hypothetical protein AAF560_10715, partial [Acidobacteriota bacterium]
DCSVYQPPSVAILDEALNLVAVVGTDEPIHMMQAVDDELVVLREDSTVIRFTSTGTRIDSWTPELEWRRSPEENRARCERAETLEHSAGIAAWIEVRGCTWGEKRTEIDGWLIEAGPGALEEARDHLWQSLGPGLCARHPRSAPPEALRRFARSHGVNQAQWIETLTACFLEPPPEAFQYAVDVADWEGHYYEQAARLAFQAWGHPAEVLESLWQSALQPTSQPKAARELLNNFHTLAEAFDDRLEHGPGPERRIIRQMLFETMRRSSSHLDFYQPVPSPESSALASLNTSKHLSRLLEMAAVWAQRDDPFTATTGELLLLGHGARPAAASLPALFEAARQDPELELWLVIALEQVVNDRDAFGALPPASREALIDLALAAPTYTQAQLRAEAGTFLGDRYRWVFEHGGTAVLERLYARALQADAAISVRQRLLGRLHHQPWALEAEALGQLLEQPWLGQWRYLSPTLSFAARLHQLLEHSDVPLREALRARTRRLVLSAAEQRPLHPPSTPWNDMDRLLAQSLSTRDVAALVERTPDGLRQWLWLVAITGPWPEIEADVEALLSDADHSVNAAIALAPERHPEAFEILESRGLHGHQAPASAFIPYGDTAQARLEPLLFDDEYRVRQAARRVLGAIRPSPETLARFAAEAEDTLAKGELPEFTIAMALIGAGSASRDALMPELVRRLDIITRQPYGYLAEYQESLEFARAVARWSEDDPERRAMVRDLREHLNSLASPAALAWLAGLEASQATAMEPRLE